MKLNLGPNPQGERPSIMQLALPSILGNTLYAVVAMVQTKFVGELGADAVAAVGAGQRVFFALQAVMIAISAGTTALVAQAWGAEDYQEASRVTMASLVLAMAFGLALTVPGVLYAGAVASIFGLDARTVELAADNIRWLSVFNVAFAMNFILGAALRAAGDAWTPLWVGIAVNVVNIPLLYGFIFGAWGLPAMGVGGAALAAGISFALGGVALVFMWAKQVLVVKYVTGGWWRGERLRRLLNVGYPAGVEMVVFQIGFFAFMMLIGNYYGTEAFAAYSVGANLLMVCMVAGFGFSIAGATLVGQHVGANDFDEAVASGWRSMRYAMLMMSTVALVVAVFAEPMAVFFLGEEPLTVRYTVWMTWLFAAVMPLLAIEFAIGGSLRGAGDTRSPLIATCVGLIGARCGLAAAFTLLELSVFWIYATLIGDYLVKSVMLVRRFRSRRWRALARLRRRYA